MLTGMVSRAALGLRTPLSVSRDVHPDKGGLAVHWGGDVVTINSHQDCLATWRNWQAFHMNVRGWVDIAYNFGVCQHGYVLAGRGLGVRSAANGTTDANDRYLAACWVGGPGMEPTGWALGAFEWIIQTVRANGAALNVLPHSGLFPTSCPGANLREHAAQWNGHPVGQDGSMDRSVVHDLQEAVGVEPDGYWGPVTDDALEILRSNWSSQPHDVKVLQTALGVPVDGIWGPLTENAYQAARLAFHGRY